MKSIRVSATLDHLDAVLRFAEEGAETAGLDPGKAMRIPLVLEEAFVNICAYAYPDGEGFAEVRLQIENKAFIMEISDAGAPFNVLSLPDPDTTLGIEEREIGGLGIHFIRKFTDRVQYRREEGRNILRMVFHATSAPTPD